MSEDVAHRGLELGGALDEINEAYYGRGWTDGLPIIPPTEGRVQAMIAAIGRDPEAVVAVIPPKWGQATIRKLAVNAVMAGCLSEYFRVILAAVEAMAEDTFNLNGIQATTHVVAPLLIWSPARGCLALSQRAKLAAHFSSPSGGGYRRGSRITPHPHPSPPRRGGGKLRVHRTEGGSDAKRNHTAGPIPRC